MATKRKADCTPEEWRAILDRQNAARRRAKAEGRAPPSSSKEYQRVKRKERFAKGELYPSDMPEYVRARRAEWLERNKGTDRFKFQRVRQSRRYREKTDVWERHKAYNREYKKKNRERISLQQREYRARLRAGTDTCKPEAMTGERVWALTLEALRGKYDEPTRMDIAGEAMVAFLEGDALNIKDAVALGMKRHWRLFSKFATRSLDAEIAEGLRLIDTIASNHMEDFLP